MTVDPRFYASAGPQTLAAIATAASGTTSGDPAVRFVGVAPLGQAAPDTVGYCEGRGHRDALRLTRAGAVILPPAMLGDLPQSAIAIVSAQPALGFSRVARLFHPPAPPVAGVHATAVVAADAAIGPGCALGPHAVIGAGAVLGAGCVLHPHAVIGPGVVLGAGCVLHPHAVVGPGVVLGAGCVLHPHSSIGHAIAGDRVVLHAGARIGGEGFGLVPTATGFETMPQLGRVLLGDAVEVGVNACIDRGALGDTAIGAGTRIDNLVQVGHGVVTGKGCILVAQSGISGSTVLGDRVAVAAQAGLAGHLRIGDGVRIGAQSGVTGDVAAGVSVIGSPAWPARETWRAIARLRQLARGTDKPATGTG